MEQRLSLITVGAADLAEARRFYLEGLGWTAVLDVPGTITFIQVAPGVLLSLYGADALAAEIGDGRAPDRPTGAINLAHNVGSPQEVDAALQDAVRAGATILKPAQRAEWGGYHGYFAAPEGTVWEVAHNPDLTVDDDGTVRTAIA